MLTLSQKRAVAHQSGPALVLAGPGSGKTLVLTNRIRSLIETGNVEPCKILVITFSRAAALEMKQRFFACIGDEMAGDAGGVSFGTFHAVFFQILREAYGFTGENILRSGERQKMIASLADHFLFDHGKPGAARSEQTELLSGEISLVKNGQIPIEYYYSSSFPDEAFRRIFHEYEDWKKSLGKLDFDDMLTAAFDLLQSREDVLKAWQSRFSHILIDEFQDINMLQYRICRMLALPENNIFAVGDDDQSIYRFRGARPELMLHFPSDYPDAALYLLEENFRCSGAVTQAAEKVIAENKNRYRKMIRAVKPYGEPVTIRRFADMPAQADFMIREIRRLHDKGFSYGEMAVLTRTVMGAGYLAERFMEYGIPVRMREVPGLIYDHWIAEDIFAILRIAQGGRDRSDFLRVCNRPLRYIGRDALSGPVVSFEHLKWFYREKPWMVERIEKWEEELKLTAGLCPLPAICFIRHEMGYEEWLRAYAGEHGIKEEELLGVMDELETSAAPFDSFAAWADHILRCRSELEKQRTAGTAAPGTGQNAVTFQTCHGAKGLEYRAVFLPDLNEGIFPHRKAGNESDLEEERRLLYVGMTRAIEKLYMTMVRTRFGREEEISRFLRPLS